MLHSFGNIWAETKAITLIDPPSSDYQEVAFTKAIRSMRIIQDSAYYVMKIRAHSLVLSYIIIVVPRLSFSFSVVFKVNGVQLLYHSQSCSLSLERNKKVGYSMFDIIITLYNYICDRKRQSL